jgi:hypothetical protein
MTENSASLNDADNVEDLGVHVVHKPLTFMDVGLVEGLAEFERGSLRINTSKFSCRQWNARRPGREDDMHVTSGLAVV